MRSEIIRLFGEDDDDVLPFWVPLAVLGIVIAGKAISALFWHCPDEKKSQSVDENGGVSDVEMNEQEDKDTSEEKSKTKMTECQAVFAYKTFWQLSILTVNMVVLSGMQLNFHVTALAILIIFLMAFVLCSIRDLCWAVPEKQKSCDLAKRKSVLTILYGHFNGLEKSLEATDIYQHFGTDLWTAISLGLAQIALLLMYVWGVCRETPDFADPKVYAFYWVGMFVQTAFLTRKDYVEKLHRLRHFWVSALAAAQGPAVYEYDVSSTEGPSWKQLLMARMLGQDANKSMKIRMSKHKWSLRLKYMLCRIVNEMGLFVILVGLPVQLANSQDPMDFVLNAVAAFFIIDLDDLENSVRFTLVESKNSTLLYDSPVSPVTNPEHGQGMVKQADTKEEFATLMEESKCRPVVVDFTAKWCPPCHKISPIFEELACKYETVAFAKVDVDIGDEVATKCGIDSMPTFQIYKDGEKVDELKGADKEGLEALLKKHTEGHESPDLEQVSFWMIIPRAVARMLEQMCTSIWRYCMSIRRK